MQSWRELESSVPFDQLPDFYQRFLRWRGIDPAGMPLRRVQQRALAELNGLVQEGRASRTADGDHLLADDIVF